MAQMPEELEVGLRVIEAGISKLKLIRQGIDREPFSTAEYSRLYTTIYDLCSRRPPHDYSKELYEFCEKAIEDFLKSTVLPSLMDKHGESLLREWVERWKNHKAFVSKLCTLFHLIDKGYVRAKGRKPLSLLGIYCLNDLVFKELKTTLATDVVNMLNDERDGQTIDCALVKGVLNTFVEIGQSGLDAYEPEFEPVFYKGTVEYYSKKADAWMLDDSCAQYMFKAEECLKKETELVRNYLHSSTEPKLIQDIVLELISKRSEQILYKEGSGCSVLLLNDKIEDLSRMYRLFSKIDDGLYQLSEVFKEHVSKEGMSLLKRLTDAANRRKVQSESKGVGCSLEQDFIRKAIELHDKHLTYVTVCFQNHSAFHKGLKEAFTLFCNEDVAGCSSAESLAAFCDNILRKGGSEKLSDEALEDTLDKVVNILTYISDKDLFLEYHRKKLGNRLLLCKSVDNDEQNFLAKLGSYLGVRSTSKMLGMIVDMTSARDNHVKFEAYLRKSYLETIPKVDLSVAVLTPGYWPSSDTSRVNLPLEMINSVEAFETYYNSNHRNRRLSWIYSMGSCNIIAQFDGKPIELIVTTYQAALLLLFNESDTLSYPDIVTQLNLPDKEVVPLLHSLSCGKYKILDKEPNNPTISPSDRFHFNPKFTDKMARIKIPLPPTVQKKDVIDDVIDDVKKKRTFSVEACIVHTMKSRKVMSHEHLIAECEEQLSRMFKPDISIIERTIEDLISRGYLEEKTNAYRYLG